MLFARLIKIPIRNYTTPICIYLYIINNALNEAEDAELRNGLLLIPYSINIFFMFYYDKQDFHV
jgi:hypothetical protein